MSMMLALGGFRFSINTAAYQSLKRSDGYRWPLQNRLQSHPLPQYIGLGEISIELNGVIYPEYRGGIAQIHAMREQASKGSSLLLVDGQGFVLGLWCISNIEETRTVFFDDGLPRKVEFNLKLQYYGGDNATLPNATR